MRQVKFRVWDGEQMISPDYIDRDGSAHWKSNSIPQQSDKLMQCTGLRDTNDQLIYEDDIIKDGDIITVVKWSNAIAAFVSNPGTSKAWPDCEVIGNIYENSDLLEARKTKKSKGKK